MPLAIRDNVDEVFREVNALVEDMKTIAASRALNTLIGQADFAVRKAIRDIYAISTRDLAPYFEVELSSPNDLVARIVAKGKGFPLRFFNPRQTAQGVVVTIKGRKVLFPHAFMLSLGGERNVFARGRYGAGSAAVARRRRGRRKAGLAPRAGGSVFLPSGETLGRFAFGLGRFPIALLRSASPPDALQNPDVLSAMQDRIDEQAPKVFARELRAVQRGF